MANRITPEDLAKSGSEFGEQSALFCWAAYEGNRGKPELLELYSTFQNFTDKVKGARAKQIGIKAGVADIFLPVPRGGFHGLYIELKRNPKHPANRGKTFKASDDQKLFGNRVMARGYGWSLCLGWEEAAAVLTQYLAQP